MNPEVQVKKALQSLAEHDRGLEAKASAQELFARRQPATNRRRVASIAVAGLAAAAALLIAVRPTTQPIPQSYPVAVGEVQPVEQPPIPVAAVAPKPVRRAKRVPQPPHEVVTEFYPLMDAPPPFERGQLLRVVVPASTMRSVGLPVRPERWDDRVQADVLVGEEGMARAIRFVSYQR